MCRGGGSFHIWPYTAPRRKLGIGIAGKDNKVSVTCYSRLDQIASDLQAKYELHPVKAGRRDIEARVWSLVHEGRPNWTMEWLTDDWLVKTAFERIIRSVQTQIELE